VVCAVSDDLHTKHFTLEQATRMLSGLRGLVEEIMRLKTRLTERGYDVYRHQYFGGTGPNGERFFPPELERLVEILKNLEEKGILVKSLDEGLIDFPSRRSNGEEVYLCWKHGEPEISSWHRISEGVAGRKPLSEF
jgi:hypothetical protein